MATPIVSQSVYSPVVGVSNPPKSQSSVYGIITEQVLAQLEKGEIPWSKPWKTLPPVNLISKKPYRGINVFLLALQGYGSQYWLTFNQAKQLGGNVRRGEHGAKIVFWKFDSYETETAEGETEERKSALLRYYTVFNLEQTEGLKALLALPPAFPIESAEEIAKGMPNPPAFEQDAQAAYIPSRDVVTMPSRTAFQSQAEYYSTLFHELTHSTGHAKRLGREGFDTPQKFGSESYSREELIAEMGSAMLCSVAGIEQSTLDNSAAYLRGWINRLRGDSRLVISAASAAQKAADYIRESQATCSQGCAMNTPTFAFPQSLSEKYRPLTITEFVGLDKPKRILAKFAANPYPSAWLFVGPPGVGKTSMALALAAQIGAELHHIPSQKCNAASIEEAVRMCHYLPMTPGGLHIVLVDEGDKMTPPAQLALLSKLDATAFPPNTVFIFTCNSTDGLEPRFLSRTRQIEFSSYGMASDITGYLDRVWHSEGGNGNGPDFERLAKDSRNNVRDCLMRLEVELMAA